MKRIDGDVVGRPRTNGLRRNVAGIGLPRFPEGVASFWHALEDPMGTGRRLADLQWDFDDFMTSCEATLDGGELAIPDPVFRERLRRRLWRTQLMTLGPDRGETH